MRLTDARLRKWEQDVEKLSNTLDKLTGEVSAVRLAAKGARLQHSTGLLIATKDVRKQVAVVAMSLATLRVSEAARR